VSLYLKIKNCKIKNFKLKGVAAIITVLSFSGLIFTISLSSAFLAFLVNQNIKSVKDANRAFYAAASGIQDSLIKLERNKDLPAGSFTLSLYNTNDVSINITNSGNGQVIINAVASVGASSKKLQEVIDLDSRGLITPTSTEEQSL